MRIYISDMPVNIISRHSLINPDLYNQIYDAELMNFSPDELEHDVLIKNAPVSAIDEFIHFLNLKRYKKLEEVTFTVADYNMAIKQVMDNYSILKAAGGLVLKDGKALLIHRLGKWDLPKGKLEKREKSKIGAIREVEEECSVKVNIDRRICTTWHTYKRNGEKILKETKWYIMNCLDDSEMKPQLEEDIDDIKWMDYHEVKSAMYNSYSSIRHVFKKYFKRD